MGGKIAVDEEMHLPPPGSRGGADDIAAPVQSAEESLKNMIEKQKEYCCNETKKKLESNRRIKDLLMIKS